MTSEFPTHPSESTIYACVEHFGVLFWYVLRCDQRHMLLLGLSLSSSWDSLNDYLVSPLSPVKKTYWPCPHYGRLRYRQHHHLHILTSGDSEMPSSDVSNHVFVAQPQRAQQSATLETSCFAHILVDESHWLSKYRSCSWPENPVKDSSLWIFNGSSQTKRTSPRRSCHNASFFVSIDF